MLRTRFLTALQGRVRDMHEAIELLRDAEQGATADEKLSRMFHSLAGIGGTYGFQEITFLANAGEEACAASDRRNPVARIALLHSIVAAIDVAELRGESMAA